MFNAIANPSPTPEVAPAASPTSPGTVLSKATDANGLPAFAQVAREALTRITPDNNAQLAHSSTVSRLGNIKLPEQASEVKSPDKSRDSTAADEAAATLFVAAPSLPVQQPPTPPAETPTASDAPTATSDLLSMDAHSSSANDGSCRATLAAQVAGHLQKQAAALFSAAVIAGQSADDEAPVSAGQDVSRFAGPSSGQESVAAQDSATKKKSTENTSNGSQPANSPAPTTPVAAQSLAADPELGAVFSTTAPAPDIASATDSSRGPGSALDGKLTAGQHDPLKAATVLVSPAIVTAVAHAESLTPVLQQVKQLQDAAPGTHQAAPVVSIHAAQPDSPPKFADAALKSSLSGAPLLANRLTSPLPSPAVTGHPASATETTAAFAAQGAGTPLASSSHASSRESSSNHDGHNSSGQPSSSTVSSAPDFSSKNDPAGFSQALASAASAKVDGSQTNAALSSVMTTTQLSADDASSRSSTAPSQASPAAQAAPLPVLTGTDTAAGRFVHSAQLVEASGHAEMRISMQTDKMGTVELHARVAGDQVGAYIGVEKRDAHAMLAVALPALQQALADKQLSVDQIALMHGSIHSNTGDAGRQAQQGQSGTPSAPRANSYWTGEAVVSGTSFAITEQAGIFNNQGRLSVRA